jgi:hypothetical protein
LFPFIVTLPFLPLLFPFTLLSSFLFSSPYWLCSNPQQDWWFTKVIQEKCFPITGTVKNCQNCVFLKLAMGNIGISD